MVRETETFFIRDENIIERLCESARSLSGLSVDGLVLGFLIEDGGRAGIDHDLLARVLSCAPNIKATFHRAFELLPDPLSAIAELKRHPQVDRILTSGGERSWPDKVERFEEWEKFARPQIGILPGGGLDAAAVRCLLRGTKIREFHFGQAAREGNRINSAVEADRVKELVELIESDGDPREAC
jgi:copper homeostasis protein